MNHKAGYINIIGKPNAGKSTLMNLLVGENVSIINQKAGMTRHRILGILNGPAYQLIFSDTPGIIKPSYKLHEGMMSAVKESLEDADILLILVDCTDPGPDEQLVVYSKRTSCYKILVLNKMDLLKTDDVDARLKSFKEITGADEAVAISALSSFNPVSFISMLLEHLPEHPAFYPKDQLTDKSSRFFVTEIIRGKIFDLFREEIPYSTEVIIDLYQETKKITRISASILVEKQSQKGIVIGPQGKGIKSIGVLSRKDIELFLQQKVFLELHVKVMPNWRKDETKLKRLGYLD